MRAFLSLAVLLPVTSAAQISFAPIGAKWTYEQGSVGGPDSNLAVIEVIGDTLISGHSCAKLQVNEGGFICHQFVNYLSANADSLWYWNIDHSQHHLLFRWNALPGEQWSTPITASGSPSDTLDWSVVDTGHVVIDGLTMRRLEVMVMSRQWNLFSPNVGVVTERIGGSSAPFTWVSGACDAETFISLRCYSDPDISWLNPQFPQCDLGTGIQDQTRTTGFTVFPTVVDRGGDIRVRASVPSSIDVFDAIGRVVSSPTFTSTVRIDRPGMYLIRARAGDRYIGTQRVLVR